MTALRLSSELVRSPYETTDKRYINGEIVNVTYHETDWFKCFRPGISQKQFDAALSVFMWNNPQWTIRESRAAVLSMSDERIRELSEECDREMDSLMASFFRITSIEHLDGFGGF